MITDHLVAMRHSPVRNYVVPGLTSWLIGQPGPSGVIRLFEAERETVEHVAPHSHRFSFQCLVLKGWVHNTIWERSADGEPYFEDALRRESCMGEYTQTAGKKPQGYERTGNRYTQGQWYGMEHEEVHSIHFGRGTQVLFFEGPTVVDTTTLLVPCAYGERVNTFKVQPWMFLREKS